MIEWHNLGFPKAWRPQFKKFNFFDFLFVVWFLSHWLPTPSLHYPQQAENTMWPSVDIQPYFTWRWACIPHSPSRLAPMPPLLLYLLPPLRYFIQTYLHFHLHAADSHIYFPGPNLFLWFPDGKSICWACAHRNPRGILLITCLDKSGETPLRRLHCLPALLLPSG